MNCCNPLRDLLNGRNRQCLGGITLDCWGTRFGAGVSASVVGNIVFVELFSRW